MSGCPSERSLRVPIGTFTLTLVALAAAGLAVLAANQASDATPSGGAIITLTGATESAAPASAVSPPALPGSGGAAADP